MLTYGGELGRPDREGAREGAAPGRQTQVGAGAGPALAPSAPQPAPQTAQQRFIAGLAEGDRAEGQWALDQIQNDVPAAALYIAIFRRGGRNRQNAQDAHLRLQQWTHSSLISYQLVNTFGAPTALQVAATARFTPEQVAGQLGLVIEFASWAALARLGALRRSAADLAELGGGTLGPLPIIDQVVALEPLSNAQIRELWPTPLINRAMVTLLQVPTVAAARGIPIADFAALAAIPAVGDLAGIVAVHQLARPNAQCIQLLRVGQPRASVAQLTAVARFTTDEIAELWRVMAFASWAALVRLAALRRTVADLIALGGGTATPGTVPTVDNIVALDRFTNTEITQLWTTAQVGRSMPALVQLAGLTRSAADLVRVAGTRDGTGAQPTRQQIVQVDPLSTAQFDTTHARVNNHAQLAQLAQLPGVAPDTVAALAQCGQIRNGADMLGVAALRRSVADSVRLLTAGPPVGPIDLASLAALERFTTPELRALHLLAPFQSWAALRRLVPLRRSAADLTALGTGTATPGAVPSIDNVVALDRFTNAELTQLWDLAQVNRSMPALVQLAGLDRSAADLIGLAGTRDRGLFPVTPTRQQLVDIDPLTTPQVAATLPRAQTYAELAPLAQLAVTNGVPAADIAALAVLPQIRGRADVLAVHLLLRPTAECLALFAPGLPAAGPVPDVAALTAVHRFSTVELTQLAAVAAFATWPALVQLAGLTRTAADLLALGTGTLTNGNRPTAANCAALERFTNDQIRQLSALPQVNHDVALLVQLAGLVRTPADLLAMARTRDRTPVTPALPSVPQLAAIDGLTTVQAGAALGKVGTYAELAALITVTHIPAADVAAFAALTQVTSRAHFVTLHGLTRSNADLVQLLTGAITNAQRPTIAHAQALDHLTNAQIQGLSALPPVAHDQARVASLAHLTGVQVTRLIGAPNTTLRSAIARLATGGAGIGRNTALRVLSQDVFAYLVSDCPLHAGAAGLLAASGRSPAHYTYRVNPRTGLPMLWLLAAIGAQPSPGVIVVADATPIDRMEELLVHEVSHARNPGPLGGRNLAQQYEDEFRSYWVAEYHTTDPLLRGAAVRAHILAGYPEIANEYNTNPAFRAAVDTYNQPAPGQIMDNS